MSRDQKSSLTVKEAEALTLAASKSGSVETLKLLHASGSLRTNIFDEKTGFSPLELATNGNHAKAAQFLSLHGTFKTRVRQNAYLLNAELEVASADGNPRLNRPQKKTLDHILETHISTNGMRGALARDLALNTGESLKKYDDSVEEADYILAMG